MRWSTTNTRVGQWFGGLLLVMAAVMIAGISATAAQEQSNEVGKVFLTVYGNIDPADAQRPWEFELTSAQAGCANRSDIFVEENDNFSDIVNLPILDDSGTPCGYTVAQLNVPSNLTQPAPQQFTFSETPTRDSNSDLFVGLVFSNSDPTIPVSAWFDVETPGAIDADAIPTTFDIEVSSDQAGCTTRTESFPADDFDPPYRFPFRTFEFAGLILAGEDGIPCAYQASLVNLPDGWVQPPVVEFVTIGRLLGGFVLTGEPAAGGSFTTYPEDSLALIEVNVEINGDEGEVPATWEFEVTSTQPGCTNEVLSIPSVNPTDEYGELAVVAAADDGEPCSYRVAEVNLPPTWVASPAQTVEVVDLFAYTLFTNSSLVSAVGTISVVIVVDGDPELAPDFWTYEIASSCLDEPLVIEVSADDRRRAPFEVPLFDADNVPCTYSVDPPPSFPEDPSTVTLTFAEPAWSLFYYYPLFRDEEPEPTPDPYVSQPVEPTPSATPDPYVSQPLEPTPTTIPVPTATAPTAGSGAGQGAGAALPTTPPVLAPVVIAPAPTSVVVVAPAPTAIVSASTYGFGAALPATTAKVHPQLALTGSDTGSVTSYATIVLLAGVFFFALSKVAGRSRRRELTTCASPSEGTSGPPAHLGGV